MTTGSAGKSRDGFLGTVDESPSGRWVADGVSKAEALEAARLPTRKRPAGVRSDSLRRYSAKPIFSMWRLSVGVISEPTTFLFIR